MAYWHGGPRIVGGMVTSASVRGVGTRSGEGTDDIVCLATKRGLAMNYATSCNGWLYEVEPIGPGTQDPHSILAPGVSVVCSSARILRRFKPSRAEVEQRAALVRLFMQIEMLYSSPNMKEKP